MRNCVKTFRHIITALVVPVLFAVLSASCTREGDSSLGYEFLPENQRLEMRHKSFRNGVVRKYDAQKDEYTDDSGHKFFTTTHFRTDSLVSSDLQTGYMGLQRDPDGIFGLREAGFASEFLFTAALDKEKGFGYKPIFDSMLLMLSVTAKDGDTTHCVKYNVYEVTKSIKQSMLDAQGEDDDANGVAYINHDMSDLYDQTKPLFTFTFPDPDNGIYPYTASVKLEPVDLSAGGATWDFIKRLMLAGDPDDGWDGYADDTEVYQSDEAWVEAFKGVFIKPAEVADGKDGGMYATDLASSGLYLYGRNRNPDEPRLIKDTVSMGYVFYDSKAGNSGNRSINYVKHDYSGSELDAAMNLNDTPRGEEPNSFKWRDDNRQNHTESGIVYVEGMGGALTELYFTDDFLNELHEINAEEDFRYASINQALIYFYIEGSDYDWANFQQDPSKAAPLLEASHSRLGIYTNPETLAPIPDYSYYYEANYGTSLNYDGYLKRSLGCYVMDVSGYLQRLKNYVDEQWARCDGALTQYEFDSQDSNYISRIIYIAPEAYSLYALQRSRLQGMEDGVNAAPIRIELTYTMIK